MAGVLPGAAGTSLASTQNLVPLADVLKLLDNAGLNFVLHTHHPLTHLEYGEATSADPLVNTRNECPEMLMEGQIGTQERG